jgi:hypothetical protein
MLLADGQFEDRGAAPEPGLFEIAAVWLVIAVTLANALSVFAQCGFGSCPSDPIHYQLFF